MKEKDLIALGFERVDANNDWYGYTYDLTQHLRLISNDNKDAERKGWYVKLIDVDGIRFTSYTQLADLIDLIEKAKI